MEIKASTIDMSVKIGKTVYKNPIITASGTFGYADELEEYMDINKIGALVTKGITLNPKTGNPQPRIKEVTNGMINSIGLENVGIYEFIKKVLPLLREKNFPFILNIAGEHIEEYKKIASIAENNNIEAIELNLSCPNVKKGCIEFGRDPETLYKLVKEVRSKFNGTLIVKLGSNVSFPEKMAKASEDAGADAISAINTVKSLSVELNYNNKGHKFIKGGMSGACIKPIALNFIYEIRNHINIPIIGLGGINTLQDIFEFFAIGADAVQVGTGSFTHPDLSEKLAEELEEYIISNGYSSLEEIKHDLRKED